LELDVDEIGEVGLEEEIDSSSSLALCESNVVGNSVFNTKLAFSHHA
jgi:hypothetical protein